MQISVVTFAQVVIYLPFEIMAMCFTRNSFHRLNPLALTVTLNVFFNLLLIAQSNELERAERLFPVWLLMTVVEIQLQCV